MRILLHRILLLILSSILPFYYSTAQVQVISVAPEQTNAAIKTIHSDHLALFGKPVQPKHQLVLMIVGTGGAAKDNFSFDSVAAALGYHVISLDYRNTVITTACSNSDDSTCFNTFRQEIVFGTDVSPVVDVDSLNSIYSRFHELLLYLAKKHPQQDWQQYIKGNHIQWQKIIVAGHSQGAGHAAYLGKKFPVARVLIFAGPQDYLAHFNSPASWLSEKGRTASSKYFAFLHLHDPFDFNKQLADCLKLMQAIKPDTLLVKPGAAVETSRHILVTDIITANPHGSMLQLPFKKAWQYMLETHPTGKSE